MPRYLDQLADELDQRDIDVSWLDNVQVDDGFWINVEEQDGRWFVDPIETVGSYISVLKTAADN